MSLSYILKVTGDCQNTGQGAVYIEPTGGVPPYDINWISPYYPTDIAVLFTGKTNLAAGTYAISITDSTTPDDLERQILFTIGNTFCVDMEHKNTTCNLDNGIISVTAFTSTNNVIFDLYTLDGIFISTYLSNNGTHKFELLPPNTYYVIATDEGGCTGKTKSCTVKPSIDFDFDLFVVDNSECFSPTGRIYVINQNTTGPFTYSWSNGATTEFITGLTSGTYSVTVTDKDDCSKTKSATVNTVPKPEFILFESQNPDCNQSNGELTFFLTGGSKPIKYILSNGQTQILYSNQVTFSNLPAGNYSITAIDPGKCSATTTANLTTPDNFQNINITANPSQCGNNQGSINIQIQGGVPPYYIKLYKYLILVDSITTTNPIINFNGLSTGTYVVDIRTNTGCVVRETVTVVNENKFSLNVTSGGTTCGQNDGTITLSVSTGGQAPYVYQVGSQVRNTTLLSQTFSDLSSGIYNVSVTDNDGCTQSDTVVIPSSQALSFTLFNTGCVKGDDATILLLITGGDPPFTIDWSPNIVGQSGIYVTGLTEGDYFVVVTDKNGCKLKKTTKIICGQIVSNYKTYTLCSDVFEQTPNTIFGVPQIYAQGFQDLTNGQFGCTLNSAEFILEVIVGVTTYTTNLGTFYSLNDYPTDQDLIDELETLLSGISGLGSIVFDLASNYYAINTDCDRELSATTITVNLKIDYDFCCIVQPVVIPCGFCKKYTIDTPFGIRGDIFYTDCFGEERPGSTSRPLTICADSTKNIIVDGSLTLEEVGCCDCNNKAIGFRYDAKLFDCNTFGSAQLNYYFVSGNTLPLDIGDFIYDDLCLTDKSDDGYYFDGYNIYYFNQFDGVYKIVYC